jgi:hypothetical protein
MSTWYNEGAHANQKTHPCDSSTNTDLSVALFAILIGKSAAALILSRKYRIYTVYDVLTSLRLFVAVLVGIMQLATKSVVARTAAWAVFFGVWFGCYAVLMSVQYVHSLGCADIRRIVAIAMVFGSAITAVCYVDWCVRHPGILQDVDFDDVMLSEIGGKSCLVTAVVCLILALSGGRKKRELLLLAVVLLLGFPVFEGYAMSQMFLHFPNPCLVFEIWALSW